MHILFLTGILPANRRSGGEIVSQLFLEALERAGHDATVVGYHRRGDPPADDPRTVSVGERFIESEAAGRLRSVAWASRAIVRRLPYTAAKAWSRSYVSTVRTLASVKQVDLVVIDHAQLAWLLDDPSFSAPIVFLAHNVEHLLYSELAANASRSLLRAIYRREAALVGNMESRLRAAAAETWALTATDATVLGARAFEVPAFVPETDGPPGVPCRDVALVGSWTWRANRHGLEWFSERVMPLLPRDLSVAVAGRGADWLRGRHSNLDVVGFVDDAQKFLRQARVVAVPSLAGSGVQVKTLDAIASGARVVATPVALRGIDNPPASVSCTDDPRSFATHICDAVDSEQRQPLRLEALAWSRHRKERFEAAVASALALLA